MDATELKWTPVERELHDALAGLMYLVDKYGIGNSESESEPAVEKARAALARARGE